jgi:hypothetical protein
VVSEEADFSPFLRIPSLYVNQNLPQSMPSQGCIKLR